MLRFVDTKPYAIENLNKLKETITKKANEGNIFAKYEPFQVDKTILGQCVLRDYSKPVDLEAMLLKDLKAAIERDYPKVQESYVHNYRHNIPLLTFYTEKIWHTSTSTTTKILLALCLMAMFLGRNTINVRI